jgi:hypothetical protein
MPRFPKTFSGTFEKGYLEFLISWINAGERPKECQNQRRAVENLFITVTSKLLEQEKE